MWSYNYGDSYYVGGELYHHGVPGMRWGHRKSRVQRLQGRRERLISKQNKNANRAEMYRTKLAEPLSMKRQAKLAKYKAKLNKAELKATKAKMRMASGQSLSSRQQRRLAKTYKLQGKVNKYSYNNAKLKGKLANTEYKNAKYQQKIDKIDKKITVAQAAERNKKAKIQAKHVEKYVKAKTKYEIQTQKEASKSVSIPKNHPDEIHVDVNKVARYAKRADKRDRKLKKLKSRIKN